MATAAIKAVKIWIEKIVIGYNFCPFAKKPFLGNKVDYWSLDFKTLEEFKKQVLAAFDHMETESQLDTLLLIFPSRLAGFEDYLDLLDYAHHLLAEQELIGVYQWASFHPDYQFDGLEYDDMANYTNRSPYPIMQILRESSVEKALAHYKNPEDIPFNNIQKARSLTPKDFELD